MRGGVRRGHEAVLLPLLAEKLCEANPLGIVQIVAVSLQIEQAPEFMVFRVSKCAHVCLLYQLPLEPPPSKPPPPDEKLSKLLELLESLLLELL
jgi:hypothetical protein